MSLNRPIPAGRTRLAPTPSGYLHIGNAFNFLLTDQLAIASGSALLLRIDDLDQERVRPEYIAAIFRSLDLLGIEWDEGPTGPDDFVRNWSQVHRFDRYSTRIEELKKNGQVYACPCSRTQLEAQVREEHRCRNGDVAFGAGVPVRLRLPDPCSVQVSEFESDLSVDLRNEMPDPVVVQRGTGRPSYQIASLCDDVDLDITFIVRGRDLLPSSACQVHMARALGLRSLEQVRFHHHPLILDPNGEKLSKSAVSNKVPIVGSADFDVQRLKDAVAKYLDSGLVDISA